MQESILTPEQYRDLTKKYFIPLIHDSGLSPLTH